MPEAQTSLLEEVAATEKADEQEEITLKEVHMDELAAVKQKANSVSKPVSSADDAPMCFNCGNQTQRAGSCYVCTACGSTTGCS